MFKIIAMLAAIGAYDTPRQEINCLSKAVYHEARGEGTVGQMAVAHVIMNRVNSPQYPNTVCEVVYQPYQFSYIHTVKPNRSSQTWEDVVTEAVFAYHGMTSDITNGATHYYAHRLVNPHWAQHKDTTTIIGGHTFKIARRK